MFCSLLSLSVSVSPYISSTLHPPISPLPPSHPLISPLLHHILLVFVVVIVTESKQIGVTVQKFKFNVNVYSTLFYQFYSILPLQFGPP